MKVNIYKVAKNLGEKVYRAKYRMWHDVPFIRDTAMVVDETVIGGGQRLLYAETTNLPSGINEQYVIDAVENKAVSLGELDSSGRKAKTFTPWYNRKTMPPGYYTHRIGDDIPSGKS